MTLGILGSSSGRRSMGSLGAEVSNFPPPKAWCWKASGYPWGAAFDACHAANYQKCVAKKLWPGTKDGDNCVNAYDLTCDCPASQPTYTPGKAPASASSASGLTMGNKTSDPRVVELQKAINAILTKNGYPAISADGKLGPGTCGAAREADKFGGNLMSQYGLTSVCTSFNAPVRSGGGFSPSPSEASLVPESSGGLFGLDSQTIMIGGLVVLGLWAMLGDKKKEKGKAAA